MTTIKDVARRAGVSPSTVSIVVKGQARERKILPETEERVLDAVRELGYTPNRNARSLKAADRRKAIGLFWADDFRAAMLARFLQGLQRAMTENDLDYEITVHPYPAGRLSEQQALAGVPPFDGIIVANAAEDDLAFLAEAQPLLAVPLVLYNRELTATGWVSVDDATVGRMAAEALAGRRRALVLSAAPAFAGMAVREQAFVEAFGAAGGTADVVGVDAMTAQAGYEASLETLGAAGTSDATQGGDRPDAIFAPSDAVALGALRALRELGIRVPDDLAVIAVGNGLPEYAEFAAPPLATVEIPMEDMAAACLGQLVELMGTPDAAPATQKIEPRLVRRDSI